MVYIKPSSIASVLALCATASALPANKIGQESGLVNIGADAQLPKVEVSLTFIKPSRADTSEGTDRSRRERPLHGP